MSHEWSSTPRIRKSPSFTTTRTILNTSYESTSIEQKSTAQRWINGMIIGSLPFLTILLCWMFVSICLNNLVRIYHRRKNRSRSDLRSNGIDDSASKINV